MSRAGFSDLLSYPHFMNRLTAPFTVFYRRASGEGGYACETCSARRHGTFERMSDVFAAATQHLDLCRGALRHRPVEGTAIIDGNRQAAILRAEIMIVTMNTVFRVAPQPVR